MNKIVNKIVYRTLQYLATIEVFIDRLYFKLRLKILSWRYGGYKSIPQEELSNLITVSKDTVRWVKIAVAFSVICEALNVKIHDTQLGQLLSKVINNCATYEENIALNAIITKDNYRRAIYEALIDYNDIQYNRAEFVMGHEKYQRFVLWLNDLSIKEI